MIPEQMERMEAALKAKLDAPLISRAIDALVLTLQPDQLLATMRLLRDDPEFDFKLMIDLTGVHWPDRENELEVVYQLLSVYKNHRLRVKVPVATETLVPSVTGIWSCANWFEREAYEMFGLRFSGHPDLRRLLTEYDSDDFPLRKEFPITGRYEVFYDEQLRRVVRKPTDLSAANQTRPDRESYPTSGGRGHA